ncbi:MAG: hypothetical protein PHQ43_00220 [Dehalococcoidales bacterium]|nr:hypothetical protein [Dehalococcoidales bacterium]
MAEVETVLLEIKGELGTLTGEVRGINGRMDNLNGNIPKLWNAVNDNGKQITAISATCAERHKNDSQDNGLEIINAVQQGQAQAQKQGNDLTIRVLQVVGAIVAVLAGVGIEKYTGLFGD